MLFKDGAPTINRYPGKKKSSMWCIEGTICKYQNKQDDLVSEFVNKITGNDFTATNEDWKNLNSKRKAFDEDIELSQRIKKRRI